MSGSCGCDPVALTEEVRPLTYAGTGPEEAEAQLGLAAIMLARLLDGFRQRIDGEGDLPDRIGEIAEVLTVASGYMAVVDPASGADGLAGDFSECECDRTTLHAEIGAERAEAAVWRNEAVRLREENGALLAERDRLAAVIDAAAKLHAPMRLSPEFRFAPWCGECSTGIRTFHDDGAFTHKVSWPCATATALGLTESDYRCRDCWDAETPVKP